MLTWYPLRLAHGGEVAGVSFKQLPQRLTFSAASAMAAGGN